VSTKHPRRPTPSAPNAKGVSKSSAESPAATDTGWRGFLIGNALGAIFGPFVRLIAALFLGAAILFLSFAWQSGPQRTIDAAHYATFTGRASGHIVESWLALEFDPGAMGTGTHWRGAAKASPCAVVEYQGDWNAPSRRAFCGNRLDFNESYTLHDLREMAPKTPFAWARDDRGFLMPQIRIGSEAREWLATHEPNAPMPSNPPPKNALDALRLQLDRPIDYAIAGWAFPMPEFPLAFDPHAPAEAMPAAFVDNKLRAPSGWWAFAILTPIGLLIWYRGMTILLGGLPPAAALFAAIVPLLAIPWWGDRIPRALNHLDSRFGAVIGEMLGDFDITGRLIASEPGDAVLADGEAITWRVGEGTYADTLGRIRLERPQTTFETADAALAALIDATTAQTRAFAITDQIALFDRLKADKLADLRSAAEVFVPAAKAALLDAQGAAALQRAARGFLSEWVTQPIEEPYPGELAYAGRVDLFRQLTDVPVAEIANPAVDIVARAERSKP
jgi:hypothetical protein